MPTYEYKCDNCGHLFDFYQSMNDDKLTKCPECGKETLKRLIGTGGGLIFKGSGFYLTDYKDKPAEKTSSSPAAASSDKSKSESTESVKKEISGKENKTQENNSAISKKSDTSSDKSGPKDTKAKTEK